MLLIKKECMSCGVVKSREILIDNMGYHCYCDDCEGSFDIDITIEEMNKIVAEFMGLVFHDNRTTVSIEQGLYCGITQDTYELMLDLYPSELRYNTSWEWLMPVIAKVNNIASYEEFKIETDQMRLGMWNDYISLVFEMLFKVVVQIVK